MKGFRIQLLIAFIVLVCGVSLIGLIYMISTKPVTYVTPGVVSVPSPVATPMQSIHTRTVLNTRTPLLHHSLYITPTVDHSKPIAAVASSHGLYLTSNAAVHTVGGGGTNMGIATTSHSSSGRGIAYSGSVTMPTTNLVALASSRQITQPEAQEAPQMASLVSGPRRAPGPPDLGGETPPPDHQLVEPPVGDALWPLALMIMGYTVVRSRRRKI